MSEAGDNQKTSLAIPIFKNIGTDKATADAELWWPRFILYMDLTQETDVTGYINGTMYRQPVKTKETKFSKSWKIGKKKSAILKFHNDSLFS